MRDLTIMAVVMVAVFVIRVAVVIVKLNVNFYGLQRLTTTKTNANEIDIILNIKRYQIDNHLF